MMSSLHITYLRSNFASCIKDCIAVAFNGFFIKTVAQAGETNCTKKFTINSNNRGRKSSNIRVTFPKAKIISILFNCVYMIALTYGKGVEYLTRRTHAKWDYFAFFDMISSNSWRINTVQTNSRITSLYVKGSAFTSCIYKVCQNWSYNWSHSQVLAEYRTQTPQGWAKMEQTLCVPCDVPKLLQRDTQTQYCCLIYSAAARNFFQRKTGITRIEYVQNTQCTLNCFYTTCSVYCFVLSDICRPFETFL